MSRSRLVLVVGASAAVYAVVLAIVLTSATTRSGGTTAIAVLAGMCWIVGGVIALVQRPDNRIGWLMLATGNLWAVAAFQLSANAVLFTIGAVFGQLALGPYVQVLMSFPDGHLHSRRDRALVATTYAALLLFPLLAALFDPTPLPLCEGCPESGLVIFDSTAVAAALGAVGAVIGVVMSMIYAIVLVRRERAASPPLRRVLRPVYLVGVGGLAAIIATNIAAAGSQEAGSAAQVVTVAFFGAVPIAFAVGVLRSQLARGSVAELAVALKRGTSLRKALAEALGDPSLAIAYRSGSDDTWVTEDGRAVPAPVDSDEHVVTPVEVDGAVVAAVVHDRALIAQPDLVEGVTAAAALALRSEGLQAQARAQYTFLATLVETARSLFVHLDTEGRIVSENAAANATLGINDVDAVRGRFFWDVFIDPSERDAVIERFRAAAPYHAADEYENSFTNARGDERVVFWRSAPVPDASGLATGVIATGIDITDRKRRELELQRERDATTTVLEATPAAIVVLARDGTIRDRDTGNPRAAVNRAFRESLGWSDEQVVGHDFLELVLDDKGDAAAAIAAAARGYASSTVESDWLRADGSRVAFSWTASPVVDVTGRTDGLVLISAVDISERKARELEAELRRAYIGELTEAIPSYLVVISPDATIRPDGVNHAFEEAFGWAPDEIAGKCFVGDVASASDNAADALIANAVAGVPQGEIESRWAARDGESRIVAWTARPVTSAQGEQLVLVAGADVTLRRLQEQEIRASRARLVQAADDTRQRLERNLHDGAQQRLVALALSLRLAQSKLASDPEATSEILTGARDELSQALEELRELARGIHPAVLTDRGLSVALEGLAQRASFPVELDVPSSRLPMAVEATAYYVVAESLTNAAKHASPTKACVRIVVREPDCVTIEVSDDGCGGAVAADGTGLRGLTDRVAVLDGVLRVDSPPGGGTRIVAKIPLTSKTKPT